MMATILVDNRMLDMNARNTDGESTTKSDGNLRDDEDSIRAVKNRSMGKADTESSGSVVVDDVKYNNDSQNPDKESNGMENFA